MGWGRRLGTQKLGSLVARNLLSTFGGKPAWVYKPHRDTQKDTGLTCVWVDTDLLALLCP